MTSPLFAYFKLLVQRTNKRMNIFTDQCYVFYQPNQVMKTFPVMETVGSVLSNVPIQ
jgi:hypothetical protein